MNLIDNGIKAVVKVTPVIESTRMYFIVEYIDWYGRSGEKQFSDITNIECAQWVE